MTIRAVVFDMDGVLIDARDWHYEALNQALGLFGFSISPADHLETFDGLPTSRKLEILSASGGLPRKLHPFINEMKQQFTIDMVHTRCRPTFIHRYALARLSREGYKLAVASNSIAETVALMMSKSRLDDYLDLQLAATDVTSPKPSPEIYETAMRRLGVEPAETLIVEDNPNGIRAALASGAHVLEVSGVEDANYHAIAERIAEVNAS